MWVPVVPFTLAGTVRQLCQPPVLAIEKLPTAGLFRLSRWTSTRPLTPAPAPDATRALNCVSADEPKLTLLYWSQSPLPMKPMSWPPPVSVVPSACGCALFALKPSAWMVDCALTPPPLEGVGVGVGVGGGVGVGVPPPPPLFE